jgi:hypothetical protein
VRESGSSGYKAGMKIKRGRMNDQLLKLFQYLE